MRALFAAICLVASCPAFGQIGPNTKVFGPVEAAGLFTVESLEAASTEGPVALREDDAGAFRYRTPLFTIRAKLRCLDEERTRTWKLGFVQVLMDSSIQHSYTTGMNGWDFPILPVNDSAGTEYPWYDGSRGYARGYGRASLVMDDNFDVRVGWFLTRKGGRVDRRAPLSRIERRQDFSVWVMAYDEAANALYALGGLRWRVELSIALEPEAPRGRRASVESWELSWEPMVGVDPFELPWLNGPTANGSQVFREE